MIRFSLLSYRPEFSTERVSFDSTVKSAGQVFRLYGTVNRKGNNESLWRKTHCTIPEPWEKVTLSQISELAVSSMAGVVRAFMLQVTCLLVFRGWPESWMSDEFAYGMLSLPT